VSDDHQSPRSDGKRSRRRRLVGLGRKLIGGVLARAAAPSIPDTAVVQVIDASGRELPPMESETGVTLLAVAREHSIDIPSYCGGRCSCGTCRIRVEGSDAGLSARSPNEAMVLGESQVRSGERLACQARLIGPVRIHLLDLF